MGQLCRTLRDRAWDLSNHGVGACFCFLPRLMVFVDPIQTDKITRVWVLWLEQEGWSSELGTLQLTCLSLIHTRSIAKISTPEL